MMCETLAVPRSAFYAWRGTGRMTKRSRDDARLLSLISAIHRKWLGIFGYRRTVDCLRELQGETVGATRVRRLMRQASLWGVPSRKRRRPRLQPEAAAVPDLVRWNFTAERPNTVWVRDLTKIRRRKASCIGARSGTCTTVWWWVGRPVPGKPSRW